MNLILHIFSFVFFALAIYLIYITRWLVSLPFLALGILGIRDMFQNKHSIIRNFPMLGHVRYLFEMIRPEISQYFIESHTDGKPISREIRSLVYQRSKQQLDTLPFGTKREIYKEGYEWLNHSLYPSHIKTSDLRVLIGEKQCLKPYLSSLLNISAMSYGSLSSNAIKALNKGAQMGGFAHNTGEGGVSSHHLENKGDLIWQIGTGYFGCRNNDTKGFDSEKFKKNASRPEVKMIELKLSQGAKPGHGGILPGIKVNDEISEIRGVPKGQDVLSPPAHRAFSNSNEMLHFINQLRNLSGGKPVGIKLCLGEPEELMDLIYKMKETGQHPDYIAIDGGEGGTGAAPLEFSNSIGFPLWDALHLTNSLLRGFDLKADIKLIASGKIFTGFDVIKAICLGADLCYSARGMMLALGCIQALRCNSNDCPTGVATSKKKLVRGLSVKHKSERVTNFHRETLESTEEILGAMGIQNLDDLNPGKIMKRDSLQHYQAYKLKSEQVEIGSFVDKTDALDYVHALSKDLS